MAELLQFSATVDISGFTSSLSTLHKKRLALAAMEQGIKIMTAASRAAAPRRRGSGALRASQGSIAKIGTKGKSIVIGVQGVRREIQPMIFLPGYKKAQRVVPANYDHLVQGGTRAHRIGKGELLARIGSRRTFRQTAQRTGGLHPGSKANPYRRRAYAAVKDQVGKVILATMKQKLDEMLSKSFKRATRKAR